MLKRPQWCQSVHQEDRSHLRLCTYITKLTCIEQGREAHVHIIKLGLLEGNVFFGSALVSMYARCGALVESKKVFDTLSVRNVVTWTTLIDAYTNQMHGEDALHYFRKMQDEDTISPDYVMFVSALKACVLVEDSETGRKMHAEITKVGLATNPSVVSSLIDMYAKCGCLVDAQAVFSKSPVEDIVMWTALIGGYEEEGYGEKVLELLRNLKKRGLSSDAVTYLYTLKACTCIGAICKGKEIHAEVAKKGLESHPLTCNTITDMYAKFGLLQDAENIFKKHLPYQDVTAWNSIIAGFMECGCCQEALTYFEEMEQCYGLSPDALTFSYVIKASKGTRLKSCNIYAIHSMIMVRGLDDVLLVRNSLVSIYASIGFFTEAYGILTKFSVRDGASWTALIAGCVAHRNSREAITYFKEMQEDGVFPDIVNYACMVKACSNLRNLNEGRKLYAEIVIKGLEADLLIGHMLIDLYTSCGALVDAQEVFDKLPFQVTITSNILLAKYVEQGYSDEVFDCLSRMQGNHIPTDAISFLYILKACSTEGSIDKSQERHLEITLKGLERHISIGNLLVDLYGKSGLLAEARKTFEMLFVQDEVSWNAIIICYAQFGMIENVLDMFKRMLMGGVKPNAITFLGLLHACNHGGLVDKAKLYYHMMRTDYRVIPILEHFACLIDLFGRASCMSKMKSMIENVPMHPSLVMWHAVLRSSKIRSCTQLERTAMAYAVELDEQDSNSKINLFDICLDYDVLDLGH